MMYLVLLESLVLCVGVFLQTGVTEECNVTFRSKLKSRTECFTTYGECGFNNLQTRFPSLYNKSEWRRDPPSNIKPSSFCEPDTSGVNQSGINIQWNLPNSHSAEGIAGYELRVEGDPLNFRCLIVILEEKPTKKHINMVLNSTMFPVRRHHNYMIVLLTLPRANDSGTGFKNIMSMNCKRGFSSRNWTPSGHNYSYDWPEKRLIVWFEPPPPKYNFTKFRIYLIRRKALLSDLIINTTEVTFTDKEPGIYTLFMEPYNENPFDKDLCVCRDDEGTCKACISSKWEITAEIPKKPPVAVSKGHLHEIIAGVCVFVVIAVVMLLLYKCMYFHYQLRTSCAA
ncbi:uncharacterized protein LOC123547043 [Mercenaria mercenaria]|uniref:uncharacterized protein LOC123547043 n=1 Tax=Mercenaria mercenaria TaxID=6596 RepID=UPI00234E417D|nr:uncharacterized protein LOC123547043 [Mercenaria mercenaria]